MWFAMSSILRVRPTKIELIRLKRRKALAEKVHRILRERLTILVNEFLVRVREAYNLRRTVNDLIFNLYNDSVMLNSVYGEYGFQYLRSITVKELRAVIGVENIMGVKTHSAVVKHSKTIEYVYPGFDSFREEARKLIEAIIELGRAEQALMALGREIERTKRKVNALKYIIIPRLDNTIRYLNMKFEEREREEKARLKRIKSILEKRR
ncbi:V-type ATPase, D subunit [Staphylothermus hellenicus DSM 12710]|uniref:A-type ATP synthase subunit D n=2 Tax=Staphylothermus hellenicus TaxID=84599 RepID=D7D9D9_STAHD|nr:V-type ATPase, D subunit [Staphylothermus hellenicus DSM 12710]